MGLRPPTVKVCPVCGEEFTPNPPSRSWQKYCSRKCANHAKYIPELNPNYKKNLDYHRKYRADNRDEILAGSRQYYIEHRDEMRAKQGIYWVKEQERLNEQKQHYHTLLKEAGFNRRWDIQDNPSWFEAPEAPLNIESDHILLTSDWHIPFDKPEYVDVALTMALDQGIPDIAVIGDFWDCDNYSRYVNYRPKETFQAELAHVTRRLQLLVNLFENVYFCVGNHEARFLALNASGDAQGHLKYQQMMNMTGITEGYTCTDNRWMTLNDEWRLTHPKNYSQIKLRVAQRLADKYKTNIISTHGHFTAGAPDPVFRHPVFMKPAPHIAGRKQKTVEKIVYVADIGGLFDESKLEYKNIVDTTFPNTNPGFAIYDHGEVTIIDLKNYMKWEVSK